MVGSEQEQVNPSLIEQDLELFLAITPGLLCILDFDGCFKRIMPQAAKLLGYDVATLIAQPFVDLVHPDDRQESQDAIAQLTQQTSPVSFENRYRCANGGYRHLVWNARTHDNVIYAAATDITEQRQAEQSLRQEREFSKSLLNTVNVLNERIQTEFALLTNQQTLANIFDLAGEAIICIDQQQQIRLYNQAAENIFGYTAAEAVGQPLDLLLPETARMVHHQHVNKFSKSSVPARRMGEHRGQVHGRRKNGEIFPAEASISKSKTREGLWFTVMLQDVTERLQAEAAIRRSEEQLRTTTNALPVLIAYIDANEHYRFNNYAYEAWLGVPYKSLEGQSLEKALGPDIYNTIQPYLQQALAGQSVAFEAEFPDMDRPYHWVSVSYQPDIQNGKVCGCFALTQDISAHKATDQLKNEFVSVVSHELRTPLTSIHGALKLLTTGQLGQLVPQGQELLEIALKNTERLTRLINDVLDLERIESGRIKMIKVRCQVADLLEQAAQAMMPMAQTHGVKVEIAPTDAYIYADPDHIEQTLTNLLSNAIKFSPGGETVLLRAVEQPHQVLFKVIDHGRGIPEDKLETIFERFQQVDASDTRKHGGTGLGLAICREIVQHHEGRIWVTSIHGQGSTFCFTLPKTPIQDVPS
ncbi:pas domain s-box [Leptolyngbya sp. Heron Island J]|uniref:PAS domain-containing sensor histidine kinase n=1 Tax=Leptolyngbya sp. Heron Island J TaxID=1385935 RepID=UPI0003B9B0E0|nr:PAS domain S-box protein [Leptolyngbya sp. Heron Island J]ESA36495.1 pas domain s-box [Leptolyngbya sp. Heron Island J]